MSCTNGDPMWYDLTAEKIDRLEAENASLKAELTNPFWDGLLNIYAKAKLVILAARKQQSWGADELSKTICELGLEDLKFIDICKKYHIGDQSKPCCAFCPAVGENNDLRHKYKVALAELEEYKNIIDSFEGDCPLCKYENGKFIEHCSLHKQIKEAQGNFEMAQEREDGLRARIQELAKLATTKEKEISRLQREYILQRDDYIATKKRLEEELYAVSEECKARRCYMEYVDLVLHEIPISDDAINSSSFISDVHAIVSELRHKAELWDKAHEMSNCVLYGPTEGFIYQSKIKF